MPDGRGSQGLLIAANAGAPIKAVADGTVVYAEWMTGYGLLLIIDHGGGYMSLYAHNDALLKDVGTAVKRGDAVATVGQFWRPWPAGALFRAASQRPTGQPRHLAALNRTRRRAGHLMIPLPRPVALHP
jgi:septal ring factor EnvC (AmiA/AmiB activator)